MIGVGTTQEAARTRAAVNTSVYVAGLPKDMSESELGERAQDLRFLSILHHTFRDTLLRARPSPQDQDVHTPGRHQEGRCAGELPQGRERASGLPSGKGLCDMPLVLHTCL